MTNNLFRKGSRPSYVCPLAEEIIVSFEECILSGANDSAGTTKSYMLDPLTGPGGGAGSGDLDGGSTDLL